MAKHCIGGHMAEATPEAPWDREFVTRLGRVLHERYRCSRARGGVAIAVWEDLPESLRASNIDHARHIRTKLASVGCRAVRGPARDDEPFPFDDAEVERLARMEHDRWVAERREAGWTKGPLDHDARTTPHLVRWAMLADDIRDLDRMFVRAIPSMLAEVGCRIVRGITEAHAG